LEIQIALLVKNMTFLNWLTATLGTGGLLAILGFFARHWIIDRLASSIKHEYDKELETHRAELQIANLRFTRVFDKTADNIAVIYEKLLTLLDATEDYTTDIKAIDKLKLAAEDFYSFYRIKKIYLPKATRTKIQTLTDSLILIARKQERISILTKIPNTSRNAEQTIQKLDDELHLLTTDIPKLLWALEDDFQRIFGMPAEEKKG
jgi:hypothetical protein